MDISEKWSQPNCASAGLLSIQGEGMPLIECNFKTQFNLLFFLQPSIIFIRFGQEIVSLADDSKNNDNDKNDKCH